MIQKYELPIRERDLLDPSKIDTIFQGVHKVLDCHVMFNIALSGRMSEWNTEEKIGDILYALVGNIQLNRPSAVNRVTWIKICYTRWQNQ